MAVTDEIIDFYSSILNETMSDYSGKIGGQAIDVLVQPALQSTREDHNFLEAVEVKNGELVAQDLSADVEVMKNGFNSLTKAMVDSLGYVFGRDEVISKSRSVYDKVSKDRAQLVADAKIAEDLPAFLKEEIWEEI